MGKSTISMVIFNSFLLCFPEGSTKGHVATAATPSGFWKLAYMVKILISMELVTVSMDRFKGF